MNDILVFFYIKRQIDTNIRIPSEINLIWLYLSCLCFNLFMEMVFCQKQFILDQHLSFTVGKSPLTSYDFTFTMNSPLQKV